MRKMLIFAFILLTCLGLAFTLQYLGDNPALFAYDPRSILVGGDVSGALLQNFFSIQDWNNYLDEYPIVIDETKLEVLKREDLAFSPKVSASGFVSLNLLGSCLTLSGGVHGSLGVNLPYEMMETLLRGIDIGYYHFQGGIQGTVWNEGGIGFSRRSGKIGWGVNLATYAIVAKFENSKVDVYYNSRFYPTSIEATAIVHTEIYSSFDLNQISDLDQLSPLGAKNAGVKIDLGVVYGDEYPVFGLALKNLTLVPAKVEYVLRREDSVGLEIDLSDLANVETSSTSGSTEKFEQIAPEDTALPVTVETFLFKRLGILDLGFRGSYDARNVWNLGVSVGLASRVLPLSFEYTYHSNGYYEKTFTLGLDLHLVACVVKLSWLSREPWDTDPATTPFAPRLDVIALAGI